MGKQSRFKALLLIFGHIVFAGSLVNACNNQWKGRCLRIVLEDHFNKGLNTSVWEHEVTLAGGGNWEFQAYTNLPENSYTRNGRLFIKPTLTTDKYGEDFLTSGVWDMNEYYGKCTDSRFWGCKREGAFGFLNPILSARLQSKATIRYGKVEILAKLPRGDWLWPAFWMLPGPQGAGKYGSWPRSGEIDLMESRGNRQYGNLGVEYMGSTLHWGVENNNRWEMTTSQKKVSGGTLASGFHKYTLDWDESGMQFYLDDELVRDIPTPSEGFFRWGNLPGENIWGESKNAPFDQPFFLILNVATGGVNGYFPDNVANADGAKPWKNSDWNAAEKFWEGRGQWQPTWNGDDAALQVQYVKMWQLE